MADAGNVEADANILEKLRKIRALAERGATPEECAAAAAILQKFMLQYSLDLEDLRDKKASKFEGYGRRFVKDDDYVDWKDRLIVIIARGNQCTVVLHKHEGKEAEFAVMGEKHLTNVVKQIYEIVTEILQARVALEYQAHLAELQMAAILRGTTAFKKPTKKVYYNSFFEGAINVIAKRMREVVEEYQKESVALSVISGRADEIRDKLYPTVYGGSSGRYTQAYQDAYNAGQAFGAKVSVRAEVGQPRNQGKNG